MDAWLMDDQTTVCNPRLLCLVPGAVDTECQGPQRGGIQHRTRTHIIIDASPEQHNNEHHSWDLPGTTQRATLNQPTDPCAASEPPRRQEPPLQHLQSPPQPDSRRPHRLGPTPSSTRENNRRHWATAFFHLAIPAKVATQFTSRPYPQSLNRRPHPGISTQQVHLTSISPSSHTTGVVNLDPLERRALPQFIQHISEWGRPRVEPNKTWHTRCSATASGPMAPTHPV